MKIVQDKGIAGKVVVVTGATGVLCSCMCEDFLKHGAKVALLGHSLGKAQDLAKKFARKGLTETLAVECNVLDKDSIEKARAAVMKKWRRIDVLVNGAGGNHPKGTAPAEQMMPNTPIADTFFGLEAEGFEAVNKLNLIGTILPSQIFGRELVKTHGCILNYASMACFQPMTKVAAYAAAKAGILNFTSWLATHLAPMGVRVNAVAPGFFITAQNKFLLLEKDEKTLTARGNKVINKTPMRRFGDPKDLCGACRFLVSNDQAGFVTGVTLPVDGGFMCYSGV
ncbi:MAG: SDR family oxidoreductase [Kiritimatiellae bacterium]|nr:SDR family oxidoreductase [Kiritimatiellia bacterium]